jgi:hypothetical protein
VRPLSIAETARACSPDRVTVRLFPNTRPQRVTAFARDVTPRQREDICAPPRAGAKTGEDMVKRLALLLPLALLLAFAPRAQAAGGHYTFDGGTRAQQGQVVAALNASSFNWSIVPGPIVIHIGRGESPHAVAGQIWLDGALLDGGRFSWGVVQHEYAHQVDFALLTDPMRAQLHTVLQGSSWWGAVDAHAQLDCERFADAVAWAYWQSPDNVMKPDSASDEGGRVAPAAFRATFERLLGLNAVRTTAGVTGKRPPRKG